MRIYISGSLAYDRIMTFPGYFVDHILPDRIHVLNVCFNINGVVEKFGGTAGNIAYSLSLLGEKPYIVATVGDDFDRYDQWLEKNGLPSQWIKRVSGVLTAGAYITTDLSDNQITAFNPGAMAIEAELPALSSNPTPQVILIAPGNKNDMRSFAALARDSSTPFIFDPGQSLNIWEGHELSEAVQGALAFISNDYELSLFLKKTGWPREKLVNTVQFLVTTRGPEGSVIEMGGDKTLIPAIPPQTVQDPTGAGDAYRAGLLKGCAMGLDWLTCCQMGSVCASFAVEHHGTQEHRFDWCSFKERYEKHFGSLPG